jgi:Matrixin
MGHSLVRLGRAFAGVFAAALVTATASTAVAFQLKHTTSGLDVRWNAPSVNFVVDPALNESVAGGSDAVASAAQGWSGGGGAPFLSTTVGPVGASPAVDGQNSVLYLHGYEPAGGALAITIVSYAEATGFIVDTDIVVNADHAFAVLSAAARASPNSPLVSTEGGSVTSPSQVFDLTHVSAHEVGHALALADEPNNEAALMYPYTRAGDASVRAPGSDDSDGIQQAYAGADLSSQAAAGCGGGASITGGRVSSSACLLSLALCGVGAWLVAGRRRWGFSPYAMGLAALVVFPGQARALGQTQTLQPDATARVTAAATQSVSGVFQTRLELVARTCNIEVCPAIALAYVWGGTMGGITQQVGEQSVPRMNDEVDLAFATSTESGNTVPTAVVLAVRRLNAESQ